MRPIALLALLLCATPASARHIAPIIDMHMHADAIDNQGPPPLAMCTPFPMPTWDQRGAYAAQFVGEMKHPSCTDPVWSPTTDDALMDETIAVMKRRNIIGVLSASPDRVARWRKAAPGRFLAGLSYQVSDGYTPAKLRALADARQLDVLAEVGTQYEGIAPDDARLEPMWAFAESRDIPVGIHIGTGPPGVIYLGAAGYRARLHSALTMEEVLVRHPKLRVYVMHAGWPLGDDMLALLYAHPQVYVDTGVIDYILPRAAFWDYIRRLTDAGFGKRIMFGSDQMVWPGTIERAIENIERDPYLSAIQKRDILYDNAARFLRLTPQQIAAHRAID